MVCQLRRPVKQQFLYLSLRRTPYRISRDQIVVRADWADFQHQAEADSGIQHFNPRFVLASDMSTPSPNSPCSLVLVGCISLQRLRAVVRRQGRSTLHNPEPTAGLPSNVVHAFAVSRAPLQESERKSGSCLPQHSLFTPRPSLMQALPQCI